MREKSYCEWLHDSLLSLPLIKFPFELESLPVNGIYFFYQKGESVNHCESVEPRIIRVGTHKNGNFRSRINEHFLIEKESKKMSFKLDKQAPKDRSIFRKHLGRCLLSKSNSKYLELWNVDFTKKKNRNNTELIKKRDIQIEKKIEKEITTILRKDFSFRYIIIDDQSLRMGDDGFEKKLVGTLSHCELCNASSTWLGSYHPDYRVSSSGLWQIHYLQSKSISVSDQNSITSMIHDTLSRIVR